ncbi:MAG: NADH-quinone oxidoreductase subunit I [Brooklawnia sp.]|jgi:ferredoxin
MSQTELEASPGHSLLLWAARTEQPGTLRVVCADAAEQVLSEPGETVIAWRGCLAELPRALPFELLGEGAERVVLVAGECGGGWLDEFTELAQFVGLTDRVRGAGEPTPEARPPREVLDADAMPVLRRRSFFGLRATAEAADPELPDRGGTAQHRLRSVIRELVADMDAPGEAPEPGWGTGALELVSQGCVACRVCVKACPTEALALESAGGRAGLGFDPSLCTGCGTCVLVCDAKALTSPARQGPPALLAAPVLLELFDVLTCARCSAVFRGEGPYCPVCAFRIANPFGSTMPPGGYVRQ